MVETGESIPQWLLSGEYTIEYSLSVSALLRQAMYYTSISAVSRFTGINQRLLNEYSCTTKKPRRAQHDIIIQGLHNIEANGFSQLIEQYGKYHQNKNIDSRRQTKKN